MNNLKEQELKVIPIEKPKHYELIQNIVSVYLENKQLIIELYKQDNLDNSLVSLDLIRKFGKEIEPSKLTTILKEIIEADIKSQKKEKTKVKKSR